MNIFGEGLAWQPLIGWGWLLAGVALMLWLGTRGLMTARSRSERVGAIRRLGMVLVIGLIGAGPSATSTTVETTHTAADVYFVVDRTGSMAAEDWGDSGEEPRLDGVRHDVFELTKAIPDARYSVIGFDSVATRQLPLTWDARAVEAWSQTLTQEISRFSRGSLLDRPLDELEAALTASVEANPENARIVYFLSDGEETVPGERRSYAALAAMIDGGAVLGYGTPDGGPMLEYVPGNEEPGYIQDPDGGDAVSVIDESVLREVADELQLTYVHRDSSETLAAMAGEVKALAVIGTGEREKSVHTPVVWPLALVLAALLAWEAAAWAVAAGRARKVSARG
ncbi:hypothetical protein BJH93_05800 [Kocuria polaris]|nr:hypothetical protein [Kocuria polaris]